MPPYESLRVSAPGATLSVRQFPGTGEPIVLLHGGPGMGDYFDSFPGMLSPPHRVVSYDQRGCGKSSCEESFEISNHVADLDAIRSYLGADRIHLFGHSWGGLLAQLYAKAHPEHVASMVLCCSMANTGPRVAMESKGMAERVIGKAKRSPIGWVTGGLLMQFPGKVGDLGYGLIIRQLMPNYFVRPALAPKSFDITRTSKRGWRETNRSIKATDVNHLAGMSLAVPILIVRGDQDPIRETHAVLSERFPEAAKVIIPDAGHFPWLEQPELFARTILAFYGE